MRLTRRSVVGALLALDLAAAGCGVRRAIDDASVLMENAADLIAEIDAKAETGEITQEVAALLDQRIRNLMDQLNTAMQANGGHLIDLANGALSEQVAMLLDQLKQIQASIADPAKGPLLDQLSGQLELQTNSMSAQLADVVSLSLGKANVILDRTTQVVVTVVSLLLLGVGVVVFAVVLFKRGRVPLRGAGLVGTVLGSLYVLFFLAMVVVRPVRAFVLATVGLGSKVEQTEITPLIRGVVPQTFILGKDPDQTITLYGWNLNHIAKTEVRLYESESQDRNAPTFRFPAKTVIAATPTRIVLGNFGKELGWKAPTFETVRTRVLGGVTSGPRLDAYLRMSKAVNEVLFPGRTARPLPAAVAAPAASSTAGHGHALMIGALPKAFVAPKVRPDELRAHIFEIAGDVFVPDAGPSPATALEDLYKNTFRIPAGKFGVRVYDGDKEVDGAQFLDMRYPPPPPPQPDIVPLGISWPGGVVAQGDTAKLRVRLGFAHPELITHAFRVHLTSPTLFQETRRIEVGAGQVQSALRSNFVDIDEDVPFRAPTSGVHSVAAQADVMGSVTESDETNNRLDGSVAVRSVVYDVTVTFRSFQAMGSHDPVGDDEYRVNVLVQAPGAADWKFRISKDGGPGKPYPLDMTRTYRGLQLDSPIAIQTSGYEADDGSPNDSLGAANGKVCPAPDCVTADPMNPSERFREIANRSYKLSVFVKVARRVL